VNYIGYVFLHSGCRPSLTQAATDAANAAIHAAGEGASGALCGSDVERISGSSVRGHHVYTSRIHWSQARLRWIAGAAAVRITARAGAKRSNYRALVCVFLFGGNDSNNTIIPMDDTNFKAYTSIRGSLALTTAELTPTVYSTANAPYAFHGSCPNWRACSRRRNWRWWPTSDRWCSR
jgi:hypothetical protein